MISHGVCEAGGGREEGMYRARDRIHACSGEIGYAVGR